MKIQLLTAVTILALSATTAQASKRSHGTDLNNNSRNALAIGGGDAAATTTKKHGYGSSITDQLTGAGTRAVAGSIYLEGGACACDFDKLKNVSRNAIAVGAATAGSIHVNTMVKSYGY